MTNHGGIYTNSPAVRAVNNFASLGLYDKDQMGPEQLRVCSRDWIDIPFQMTTSSKHACAFNFESKSHGIKTTSRATASAEDPTPGTAHGPESSDGEKDEGAHVVRDGKGGEGSIVHDTPSVSDVTVADHLSGHGERIVSQFIERVLSAQQHHHRTFSYAVYICCDMARLFHIDRAGAYVCEPFRWKAKDSLLHDFVWKIAKLANAGRFEDLGHDLTATLASSEAKDKFLALKTDMSLPPHVRDGFKKATADRWPIYQLEVVPGEPSKDEWFDDMTFPPPKEFGNPPMSSPSQSTPLSEPSSSSEPLPSSAENATPSVRHFLVGRPQFAAYELVGRCTRGYFAYDVTDPDQKNWRVCFLKDSWRPVVPGLTRPEHLVYQRLRFYDVNTGIGTLICGGDVGRHWAQRTQVQDYLPREKQPVLRVHYRLVIEEVGIPLEDFGSFPELSGIFVDVIHGMLQPVIFPCPFKLTLAFSPLQSLGTSPGPTRRHKRWKYHDPSSGWQVAPKRNSY